PTGTSGCGRFGTSSMRRRNSSSASVTARSAAAMRSPTPRCAAMAASRAAPSFWSRMAFDADVRSARSVSTAWIASRRLRSASTTASTATEGNPTFASSAFTRSGSARISRMSSITPPSVPDPACPGSTFERSGEVLDDRRIRVEADADDVESGVPIVPPAGGQEVPRDPDDLRRLPPDDRLERRPDTVSAPRAHLHEHDRRSVERDEVDLAREAAVVARHDRSAPRAEELLRHRLPAPPELQPPVHGAEDYSALPAVATGALALRLRIPCARTPPWRSPGMTSVASRSSRVSSWSPPRRSG